MPQALTSLTSLLPLLTAGGAVASGASNVYQGYKDQQYQDQLRSLAGDPSKFNAYAGQFVQPLNAGLLQGVENQAQASAAERGLGSSPSLTQEIVSQAIAPYMQQNQQFGYNEALQALGLGGGAKSNNTSQGLTQLFSGLGGLGAQGQLSGLKSLAVGQGPADYQNSPSLTTTIPYEPAPSVPGIQDFSFDNTGWG